jgi:tetratricopeptide (TPR) repeat protein
MKLTAGLILAGVLLYGASVTHPFHFDDALITHDSNVTNPARWAHFFNPLYLRQLTFFTFYLNHLVGGLNPAGYHAANVAIHIANAVLLFFLLGRFTERWIAMAAAAVFLAHPIQTEPVLYVYQRSILLACFFSLLGLIALAERRTGWAALAFLLAFESKESAIAVPLAVALLGTGTKWKEISFASGIPLLGKGGVAAPSIKMVRRHLIWRGRGGSFRKIFLTNTASLDGCALSGLRELRPPSAPSEDASRHFLDGAATPPQLRRGILLACKRWLVSHYILAVLGLALGVFTLGLLWHDKTVGLNAGMSPLRYLLTETRVIYTYLRLLVFPYPQSLEYDFHDVGGILPAAGIVSILIAGWLWRSLSVLAFFVLLAPTSSIIPSADAAFEHRLYLPMLAFSLLAAYLLSKIRSRTAVAAALLLILAVLTVRRETVWSSDITLWEDASRHAPGKARVWFNLGGAYMATDPEKARPALLRALELQPHFPEALYDLGVIEQEKKNWNAALTYYQRVLEQDPDYWPASNNMGNTLFAMGQPARSMEFFDRTLRLNPDYWPAQYNIAIVHFISGRYTDAAPRLRTVLDWRPDFPEARYLLAMSLTRSGDRRSADEEWKKLGEVNAAESRYTPTMILAPNRP